MNQNSGDAAIPASVQALLDLFEGELHQVKFADVDQAVLVEAADRVRARAEEVARAEAALQAAREALSESQDALVNRCQRGLAYARIFAEDDADLLRRLEGISLPRRDRGKGAMQAEQPEGRPPGKRGRRAGAQSGALFVEAAPEAADASQTNGLAH